MTEAEILAGVLDTLQSIAPEVPGDELLRDQALRDQAQAASRHTDAPTSPTVTQPLVLAW